MYNVAIRKAQAASAQSFTLYPQAKTYFTCHDHSFIACLRHVYILLFFTHILFVVNPTFNATSTERLQQHPLLFTTTAPIARSLYKGWTRHDLHILVTAPFCCYQKSASSICAKLRTVAASNNRVHMLWSLYYCLFAPCIYIAVLCTPPVRGESHI